MVSNVSSWLLFETFQTCLIYRVIHYNDMIWIIKQIWSNARLIIIFSQTSVDGSTFISCPCRLSLVQILINIVLFLIIHSKILDQQNNIEKIYYIMIKVLIESFPLHIIRCSIYTHLKDITWRRHFDHNCLIILAWPCTILKSAPQNFKTNTGPNDSDFVFDKFHHNLSSNRLIIIAWPCT